MSLAARAQASSLSRRLCLGSAAAGAMSLVLPRSAMAQLGQENATHVTLGFRPESVELVGEGQGFPMTVDVVEALGSDAFVYGRLGVDQGEMKPTDVRTIVRVDPRKPPAVGEVVYLRIRENESHIFSPTTGARLGD